MKPDLSRKNGDVKNALSSKTPIKRAAVFINSEFHKMTCGMSVMCLLAAGITGGVMGSD